MDDELMNNPFEAVVRDLSALRGALQEADVVPALMVLTHLSGDTGLLERAAPHIQGGWNYQASLPPALASEIRERLVQELQRQAADPQEPALPSEQTLQRIMSASVGAEVPAEYVPLFVEELQLGEADTRALNWRKPPSAASLDAFRVVIVGAGLGGICMGIRLKQAGIPFVILERRAAVGGTWHENSYPGCGVDTPSHFYSYSFHQNPDWSRYFAKRDEIWRYIDQTVDTFGLRPHIRFGVEVERCEFDEAAGQWQVQMREAGGEHSALRCQALVMAAGHNVPATPAIEGRERFAGPVLHTAQWDHGVNLKGLRVAMIGTGASGMQAGPSLAPEVAQLTVFQRTPHWAMGNPNYHREVSRGQQWALRHIPYFREWSRFLIFWAASDAFHRSLQIDRDWDQPALSLNRENHQLRETIIEYMRQELDGDEALLRKCTPSYPPYGKRLLRDNHWFRMLKRPNVELVTEAISHLCPEGVVTTDGRVHAVDAVVMATGFHASRLLWPMEIIGRGGVSIRERWGEDDPRAYKGMTVPGFPNFFVMAGPNTILSHGGSAIFHAECQVSYIAQALREMVEQRLQTLEVRPEVHDRYNALVDEKHRDMVWAHPGVTSWYKNRSGRVTMSSPWRLVDYWRLTREFDPAEYLCTQRQPARGEGEAVPTRSAPPASAQPIDA
jgi:4-hydroxyacetophenone monooxygenase